MKFVVAVASIITLYVIVLSAPYWNVSGDPKKGHCYCEKRAVMNSECYTPVAVVLEIDDKFGNVLAYQPDTNKVRVFSIDEFSKQYTPFECVYEGRGKSKDTIVKNGGQK